MTLFRTQQPTKHNSTQMTTQQKVLRYDAKQNYISGEIISSCFPLQVIQTIQAADPDSAANGKFSFYFPTDYPVNPNLTLRDNGGKTPSQIRVSRCITVGHMVPTDYCPLIVFDTSEENCSPERKSTLDVSRRRPL